MSQTVHNYQREELRRVISLSKWYHENDVDTIYEFIIQYGGDTTFDLIRYFGDQLRAEINLAIKGTLDDEQNRSQSSSR